MPSPLAGHLRSARHVQFVGRQTERALFESALVEPPLPFHIIYVSGPGGIGKSTLLHEFGYLCGERNVPCVYLDVRSLDPAPEAFLDAIARRMALPKNGSIFEEMASHAAPYVLLVDTYEMMMPLDEWMRTVFLPQLPVNALVVLAGRQSPSPSWRADPGWQTLIRLISLRNLSADESRDYLGQREVPSPEHQTVLDFTYGHPLALSLVADMFSQRADFHFQPEESPDIVKTLLEQFVQKVPNANYRTALEVCALLRITTESLLAKMLNLPDVHEVFEWLRDLSFIESRRDGLFPHDLAREALLTDLRWRNPEWYAELHDRARDYYIKRLSHASTQEQQRILMDYIYLHRDNPMVRPFFEWQSGGSFLTDSMQPQDVQVIKAMVAYHEGAESSRIASYWLSRFPQHVVVWRDAAQQPVGFVMMLPLEKAGLDTMVSDPAVRATWGYLQNHFPLRPGEVATLFRFWMAKDSYQDVSPVQSLVFVQAVRHYLFTTGLAYTFFPVADAEFWEVVFGYADLERLPGCDFAIGDRRFGMFGHDWRSVPPMTWLELLAKREIAANPNTIESGPPVRPMLVLSQNDFGEAVRDALRDYTRIDLLQNNPLIHSRVVVQQTGPEATVIERVTALQARLRDTVEMLRQSPRQAKAYRALYHTYVQPASTQEQAAEILDLPFSTYRRHLKAGLTYMIDFLWRVEIGEVEK